MINAAVSNNTTNCYYKIDASQLSLWDEPAPKPETQDNESRQQELIEALSTWAVLNAYPELPMAGVKAGRSNWAIESWDLPRLETIHKAADLYSRRQRAHFALSHWAIMHGHPCVAYRIDGAHQQIETGLVSWVTWCKQASLETLCLVLETVTEAKAA